MRDDAFWRSIHDDFNSTNGTKINAWRYRYCRQHPGQLELVSLYRRTYSFRRGVPRGCNCRPLLRVNLRKLYAGSAGKKAGARGLWTVSLSSTRRTISGRSGPTTAWRRNQGNDLPVLRRTRVHSNFGNF